MQLIPTVGLTLRRPGPWPLTPGPIEQSENEVDVCQNVR